MKRLARTQLVRARRLFQSPRARAFGRVALGLLLLPFIVLGWTVALEPLPTPLSRAGRVQGTTSTRVLDAHGRLIRELRSDDGMLASRVSLDELPDTVVSAVLAAEDARFYRHPGVDPLAMMRAAGQMVVHGRVVSGASTITQQLARSLFDRPRTFAGKFREIALALRIEASLDKRAILEEYLNRVEFGANVRGIDAASRLYFDKPASKLDLSEAAALAAIPRGPSLYDPRRGVERVTLRRDRILERMRERGLASPEAVERARALPVVLMARPAEGGAKHFVRAIQSGRLAPELGGRSFVELQTTLDADLQREVETLTRQAVERIVGYDATAASVVVLDNATGDVLAYVGSPSFDDAAALGQNDGVLALRQPGSTLKPFVYATAVARLGMTAATVLPDVELHISTPEGDYSPRNYDGRFHGPVRMREALGNSLNVPAVYAAQEAGPQAVLDQLRRVGFVMLDRDARHYGAAIALGDGEVTLLALAEAYSSLAQRGQYRPARAVKSARLPSGEVLSLSPVAPTRAVDPAVAELVTDILADPHARTAAFGRENVLELPFDVAAKTGTSKGFRDNWTVGYTREVTVAVWVGNFDGRPMRGSSGVTGAAPLFRDAMVAAMRGRAPEPLAPRGLVELEVCALSGKLPGPHCRHRVRERFVIGQLPHEDCDMHVEVSIERRSGLLAGNRCDGSERQIRERYPSRFAAWAEAAGRPVVPSEFSARCPGDSPETLGRPALTYPFSGARFAFDPALPASQQAIVLAARAPQGVDRLRFVVDGRAVGTSRAPFTLSLSLSRGRHRVEVETLDGRRGAPADFSVD